MDHLKLENNTIYITGSLIFETIASISVEMKHLLHGSKPVMLDVSGVIEIDSAGVAFLEETQIQLQDLSGFVLISGASPAIKEIMETFTSAKLKPIPPPVQPSFFEGLGDSLINILRNCLSVLYLSADVFFWAVWGLVNRKAQRKGATTQQAILLGVQALPIVLLLSFIIGFILSLQSAIQLRNFGGNVFLADLLSITMVREMGPLITAIIVAGRSGSSIASEIATMQVSEELDALKIMALNPIRYVVVPKFHAITFVMPILVTFSIMIGVLGGLMIAVTYLDVSLQTFLTRTIEILTIKDIIISLVKSTFFAWVIVIIGSFYGFTVKGGAEGVGKATTSAVVSSIFAVIMFDALFSLLYL
ncbi:MAG: MlaE family lipid ABC transporter permease subunit [Candidatus Cloacimonetes bacterium]|nr:MlaE family lipid ABC transporter permease subunit [Candidatus Cloacimonadota bacterium]